MNGSTSSFAGIPLECFILNAELPAVVQYIKAAAMWNQPLGTPTPAEIAGIDDAIFWLRELQAELTRKHGL